jgi:hypothetical protein
MQILSNVNVQQGYMVKTVSLAQLQGFGILILTLVFALPQGQFGTLSQLNVNVHQDSSALTVKLV